MIIRRVWPGRPTFDAPWPDFEQLRRDLLHTFDVFAGDREQRTSPSGVFPPINVMQDADRFYVRAEIPGVVASELSIRALQNRLSISGKREIPKEHERVSYHRKERPEGTFNRTLTLPMPIDAERIDARYADGILTLTLPKAEEAKPRQIAVKT
jgi:HSP20 family protein